MLAESNQEQLDPTATFNVLDVSSAVNKPDPQPLPIGLPEIENFPCEFKVVLHEL